MVTVEKVIEKYNAVCKQCGLQNIQQTPDAESVFKKDLNVKSSFPSLYSGCIH